MKIFEKIDEISFAYKKFEHFKNWQVKFIKDNNKDYTEVSKDLLIHWIKYNKDKLEGLSYEYHMYKSNMQEEIILYKLRNIPYKIEYN